MTEGGTTPNWRRYRPAIWLAMLGIALVLLNLAAIGIACVGGAIGIALRIWRGRPPRGKDRSARTRPPGG